MVTSTRRGDMALATLENTTQLVTNIVTQSSALFKRHGYKKTTVDDIVSAVKISKKTLYALFGAKEDILRECLWRDTREAVLAFDEAVEPGAASDELFVAFCRFILTDRIRRGREGLFWGLYHNEEAIVQATREALVRVLAAIYADGRAAGLVKQTPPDQAALIALHMVLAALESFSRVPEPTALFNDTLAMIGDAMAFNARRPFESRA